MVRDLGQLRGLASRLRTMLQEIYKTSLVWNFFEVRRFQLWMPALQWVGKLRQKAVVRVYSCNACFVWSLLLFVKFRGCLQPCQGFFQVPGVILVLGGRNVKHLVVTWVGFCVGKGGYRGVRRCHDTSRKNKVRRKRDVVVIGGQGLDFPADLHAP